MTISVLGGMARGFTIKIPPGHLIRPMSVKLKRRLFDAHQNLSGNIFIDLCAGSGAIGIEAWSRGAEQVFLCEKNRKVWGFTQENLKNLKTKFSQDVEQRPLGLAHKDCSKWLQEFLDRYDSWDLEDQKNTVLFLAPPYEKFLVYESVLKQLPNRFKGVLWCESDRQKGPNVAKIKEWLQEIHKEYVQGTTFIAIKYYS